MTDDTDRQKAAAAYREARPAEQAGQAPGAPEAPETSGASGASGAPAEPTPGEQLVEEAEEMQVLVEDAPDGADAALAALQRERDEYLDQAQRARAEYLNLKRRTEEQLATAQERGQERLLGDLLGALENFGYVADGLDDSDDSQVAKGVRMVWTELTGALEAAGLQRVAETEQPFDPLVHDALLSEESEEPLDEPVVTEILRPGFRFKGRTLRPASVKVRR